MSGTGSNRSEELSHIASIERNNQNATGKDMKTTVKHTGIGTALGKNQTNSGGINRATKPYSQK